MAADEPRLSKVELALIGKYKQLRKQQVDEDKHVLAHFWPNA
jgi:hypothetical protein